MQGGLQLRDQVLLPGGGLGTEASALKVDEPVPGCVGPFKCALVQHLQADAAGTARLAGGCHGQLYGGLRQGQGQVVLRQATVDVAVVCQAHGYGGVVHGG